MKRILFGTGVIMLLLTIGCKHTNTEVQPAPSNNNPGGNGGNGGDPGNEVDTSLCFERDILPIFISNCAKAGCHDAASRQEGYEFTSYATITAKKFYPGNPEGTELYEKITEDKADKIMPPKPNAPLTSQQISLIYEWIRRGAPNTTGCKSNCDSNAILFAKDIQPIFNQYCKGCHSTSSPSLGISLDNYTGVNAVVSDGRLLKAINHLTGASPMPKGGNKLSACRIRQIEKWVAAGAQNN